jgi:hypothetical protein
VPVLMKIAAISLKNDQSSRIISEEIIEEGG